MSQQSYRAIFMRGGTSKGVFFRDDDLPGDRETRDRIFIEALGSPDGYGRQLNGMGGGLSSVSKAVVVGPPSVEGADVDYTFAQVVVDAPEVDYSATCGNLSSAIGPFAIDMGMLEAGPDGERTVRVHNTNTNKIYEATFHVRDGKFDPAGDFEIPGVSGSGSRIRLDYLDPGGATSGELLPSGNALDVIEVPGLGEVEASLVDATNALIVVAAERLGKTANESVEELENDKEFMDNMDKIRRIGAVQMGLAESPEKAPLANPKIAIIGPPADGVTLAGEKIPATDNDLCARIISMEKVHRALTMTGALGLGVTCRIPGTVAQKMLGEHSGDIRLLNPSGVLPVNADVDATGDKVVAHSCTAYRTARPLMTGEVLIPAFTNAA